MVQITSVAHLKSLYDAPVPLSITKVQNHLTPKYRAWIEGARFCILSTYSTNGVHATPRGDDGPVIKVLDDHTMLMPDWRGNNRIEALLDIVEQDRIALLFMISGSKTTIRVNGTATLHDDTQYTNMFKRRDRTPTCVILIKIVEVYSQCAKALMRSDLWNRNDSDTVPTIGDIMAEITNGKEGGNLYDQNYERHAQERMW